MNYKQSAHKSGDKVVAPQLASQVEAAITAVRATLKKGTAASLRKDIRERLATQGWSEKVRISAKGGGITLASKHGSTALCLQTGGNMARFYADLLKLQAQFLDGKLTAAIFILPCKSAAAQLGSNLANFERLNSELTNTFSKVITVPLLVYGFYNDNMDGGK